MKWGRAHLAASQLQMMKNHLNLLWWKAPYSVSGCSCESPGKVKGSPRWYTWACNPPAGGMAALPHPLGFFLSSPALSIVSSWVEPFWDLYYKAMPQAENAANSYLLWGTGKMQRLSSDFLCLCPLFPFPVLASITPLLSFSLFLLLKSDQWYISLLVELWK